ncbi:elongation factor Ts [bacterium]|nr:elongation factor Ts [bacterium]
MKNRDEIMAVRQKTGAGLGLCKKAIAQSDGDIEQAIRWVASQGKAIASEKSSRSATEGRVGAYVHTLDPKLGSMVDLACETDFVARTEMFIELANDLAQQVVAYRPSYVDLDSVPSEVIEEQEAFFLKQAAEEGKPEAVAAKISEGRMRKWCQEYCLLDQPWINDSKMRVREAIEEKVASLKENIKVRGFVFIQSGGNTTVG